MTFPLRKTLQNTDEAVQLDYKNIVAVYESQLSKYQTKTNSLDYPQVYLHEVNLYPTSNKYSLNRFSDLLLAVYVPVGVTLRMESNSCIIYNDQNFSVKDYGSTDFTIADDTQYVRKVPVSPVLPFCSLPFSTTDFFFSHNCRVFFEIMTLSSEDVEPIKTNNHILYPEAQLFCDDVYTAIIQYGLIGMGPSIPLQPQMDSVYTTYAELCQRRDRIISDGNRDGENMYDGDMRKFTFTTAKKTCERPYTQPTY